MVSMIVCSSVVVLMCFLLWTLRLEVDGLGMLGMVCNSTLCGSCDSCPMVKGGGREVLLYVMVGFVMSRCRHATYVAGNDLCW